MTVVTVSVINAIAAAMCFLSLQNEQNRLWIGRGTGRGRMVWVVGTLLLGLEGRTGTEGSRLSGIGLLIALSKIYRCT